MVIRAAKHAGPVVELESAGSGIAILRFWNEPTGLLTGSMAVELEQRLQQLAADENTKVIVLTGGQPDVFIRHFDVVELAAAAEAVRKSPPPADAEWSSSLFHRSTRLMEQTGKPVIAAINGTCMGVGYELALACDLRIASAGDYPIGLPEVNLGICPGGGGTVRLAKLLGPARAMELLFTGQTMTPLGAATVGLVNWVTEDALSDALTLARDMTGRSTAGIAAVKSVCRASADLGIEAALTFEQRVVNTRMASEEMASLMKQMNEANLDIREVRVNKASRINQ